MNNQRNHSLSCLTPQCREIVECLQNGSLTTFQATAKGIMGFYTRINELRNLGYVIDCIPEKHINKRGRQVVRGRYVLRSEPRASPKEPKEQETPLTDSTP